MKRPDFQEKTEVKVIDRGHHLYSKRAVDYGLYGRCVNECGPIGFYRGVA